MYRLLSAALLCFGLVGMAAAQPTPGEARLRPTHFVIDAPNIDITLNGMPFAADIAFEARTQHSVVPAGRADLAIIASGATAPLFTLTVDLQAGSDYTLALIGQIADGSAYPLLLDETELVASVRDLDNPASYAVLLHGISNGPTVDFEMDDEVLLRELAFGDYGVIPVSLAPHNIRVRFTDEPSRILFQNDGETPPSADLLLLTVMTGSYPDNLDVTGAVSRLPDRSVLDFLATYQDEAGNTFSTLIAAIQRAGLEGELSRSGSFTLFAPTDAAFAELADETRALLFAYPDALRAVLLGHVVDEIFTIRDIDDPLVFETRGDTPVRVSVRDGALAINDEPIVLFGAFPAVTNGNVIGVDQVLMPATAGE
jgi:uncharacterized surface protein with fasciclin (FAS1) repeats